LMISRLLLDFYSIGWNHPNPNVSTLLHDAIGPRHLGMLPPKRVSLPPSNCVPPLVSPSILKMAAAVILLFE
jgi:hypothetical protein